MEQSLAERYARITRSLPSAVKLIAVSKTRAPEEIKALYDLGQRAFGENYPQELRDKQAMLPADIEWHFIGHLQSNKVRLISPFVHLIHAVDSERLMDEIEKRAVLAGRRQDVLFQVHIAKEETKHGFGPEELRALLHRSDIEDRWPHARVRGLMGMATNTEDRGLVAYEFSGLGQLFREIRDGGRLPAGQFTELSMGMTSDADLAIASGSTMVRIGTALFGDRPPKATP